MVICYRAVAHIECDMTEDQSGGCQRYWGVGALQSSQSVESFRINRVDILGVVVAVSVVAQVANFSAEL